jgi:hypothetical protein
MNAEANSKRFNCGVFVAEPFAANLDRFCDFCRVVD